MFQEQLKKFYNSNRPDGVYSIGPMILWNAFSTLKDEYRLFMEGTEKTRWEQLEDRLTATKIHTEEESLAAAITIHGMLKKAGIPAERLLLPVLIGMAYQEEARCMIGLGMDPEANPPFSFTIGLNHDCPVVKEILEEEKKEQDTFWRQQLSFLE